MKYLRYFAKSFLLLGVSVLICCIIYPLFMWAVGQTFFHFQANGSLLKGPDGVVVGSRIIAQPFSKDEYFQPRPSAASFDASASASSALSASNYALRDRVARQLGPIVTYSGGPKAGQRVAPDVEAWFQKDRFQGDAHLVGQWADKHNSLAQAWVGADPKNGAYVDEWSKKHAAIVVQYVKDNPATPQPKNTDLAVVFFKEFSASFPGRFPSAVTKPGADGKPVTALEPVKDGSDVQSIFFDMWRSEHADAQLKDVPGDMVTTSASGLDPHISMQNAEFQLDRVAAKWAANLKLDPGAVRAEIEQILQRNVQAPFNGLAGEKFVNVLELNLTLRKRFGQPS
jgi:potassium-transporting ATPase KdpC subunit